MNQNKTGQYKILVVALLTAAIILSIVYLPPSQVNIPAELTAVIRSHPVKLKPFSLSNQHGQAFTLEQLKNKQSLIFFGYTSCPDICPSTLSTLNILSGLLDKEQAAKDLQIIFVSVDPQRDTTAKLADYVNYFNKSFIALTGSQAAIDQYARQFGAAYFIEEGASTENYLIGHASSIFLVNREAELIAAFSPPHDPQLIADQYLGIYKLFNTP